MSEPTPYQELNARTIDGWCKSGWEWGRPVDHETIERAKNGDWAVRLTPVKTVPREWLGDLNGKSVLGLAAGGGQQLPVFSALGASCFLLDISPVQCETERMVANREGMGIEVVQGT